MGMLGLKLIHSNEGAREWLQDDQFIVTVTADTM